MKPSAQISLEGDELILQFEQHSVKVKCDEKGLRIIKQVLAHRQNPRERTVATPGAPIQYIVDAWLKEHKPTKKLNKTEAEALIDLSELEFDL